MGHAAVYADAAQQAGSTPEAPVIPLPAAGAVVRPRDRASMRAAPLTTRRQLIAQLAALDAIRAAGLAHKSNIKFMFEGEEEVRIGRTWMPILQANRALFAADVWLMCDGPVHQSRKPGTLFRLTRRHPPRRHRLRRRRTAFHSGHYGNWAPNPAMLSRGCLRR